MPNAMDSPGAGIGIAIGKARTSWNALRDLWPMNRLIDRRSTRSVVTDAAKDSKTCEKCRPFLFT